MTSQYPIAAGMTQTGYPAVGMLFSHTGTHVNESCSGTLIAASVVLTAGHCFDTNPMDAFYLGQGTAVAGGDTDWEKATVGMRRIAIDRWARPASYRSASGIPPTTLDIAVAHLAQSVIDVTPLELGSMPPPAGAAGIVVGFGRHPTSGGAYDQLTKRSANVAVSRILSTTLLQTDVTNGVPLNGDSGGPFIHDGRVAGTACCGHGPNLAQTDQYYARVDLAHDWIVEKIAEYGGAVDGGILDGGSNVFADAGAAADVRSRDDLAAADVRSREDAGFVQDGGRTTSPDASLDAGGTGGTGGTGGSADAAVSGGTGGSGTAADSGGCQYRPGRVSDGWGGTCFGIGCLLALARLRARSFTRQWVGGRCRRRRSARRERPPGEVVPRRGR
jgi:hypothetical protein